MLNVSALLPDLVTISEQAGQLISTIYRQPSAWQLQHKDDNSPLTAADLAAHEHITQALQQLTPQIPVVSEESNEQPERQAWSLLWLVDPLDGTREFVAHTDEFTVNIALVENGLPILGVIHAPILGMTYAAVRGGGAWRYQQQTRQAIQVRTLTNTDYQPRILMSRFHKQGREEKILQGVRRCFGDCHTDSVGSALKMCWIAEGKADVYPRFGTTMEWDTAAGQIILQEAGGLLVDLQGRPFVYNERNTLKNSHFLVLGQPQYLHEWLAICQGAC